MSIQASSAPETVVIVPGERWLLDFRPLHSSPFDSIPYVVRRAGALSTRHQLTQDQVTSPSLETNAHSDVVTHGVRVVAAAEYAPRESDPDKPLHMFVYRVRITNEGERTVRLESRHWVIVDGNGERRDVRGPGVVGEYPSLAPGQSFQYESRCPLTTSWGTMEGSYRFAAVPNADESASRAPLTNTEGSESNAFDVAVGRFFLAPSVPPIVQQMSR